MGPAESTAAPTQLPTPAASRVGSPPNTDGSMLPPADTAMSASTALTVTATLQQCLDASPHYFTLKITDVQATQAHYDPAAAVPHLNAVLQDALATVSNIEGIPVESYHVTYETPPPELLGTHGHFVCRIPEPLKDHIPNLTNKGGPLEFTGDD